MARICLLTLSVAAAAGLNFSTAAGQTPQLHQVMREKLGHSQKILEAVVTSNWQALEAESLALKELTMKPEWAVLTAPEYVRHTTAFVQATQDLLVAARERDLDAAPLAYVSLTLSCVQCHRYVARSRVAVRTGEQPRP
jgi:hypothetical protein